MRKRTIQRSLQKDKPDKVVNFWKNQEGYPDPTAGQALDRILRSEAKKRTTRLSTFASKHIENHIHGYRNPAISQASLECWR